MRVTGQETIPQANSPQDLENVLSLSVDDALSIALSKVSGNKELSSEWYEAILEKLGETERNAYTLALASEGIKVLPKDAGEQKESEMPTLDELKKHFSSIFHKNGWISEEDYRDACYEITDARLIGQLNDWLMSANLPMLRKVPDKKRKPISEQYKKEVTDVSKHPNINKLQASKSKKVASVHLNKAIDEMADAEFEENSEDFEGQESTRFLTPWKKVQAQRIDDEKRQLEDTIRSRQSQLPNWKKLLEKVRNAFDFSELEEIWNFLKGTPAYAKLEDPIEKHIRMASLNLKDFDTRIASFDKTITTVQLNAENKFVTGWHKPAIFHVYVAKTDEQKVAGLEPFDKLDEKKGMLFPFGNERVMFHMGKVQFPIDIIFLMDSKMGEDMRGKEMKVAKIIHNVQPGDIRTWSFDKTAYVLELLGGTCKKHQIAIGTTCWV